MRTHGLPVGTDFPRKLIAEPTGFERVARLGAVLDHRPGGSLGIGRKKNHSANGAAAGPGIGSDQFRPS
jgi:hypothetical protein